MKRTNRILSMILGVAIIFGASSCKDDEPDIPSGGDGIAVGDGFYITQEGVDPVSTSILVAETVEDDGFTSQAREGYVAGYVYLEAGNYNVVNIESKAIKETFGGSVAEGDNASDACGFNTYSIISLSLDGAAFNVAKSGLYKVTYDATTSETILYEIVEANIMGSVTPGGWNANGEVLNVETALTSEGGTWSISDYSLPAGGEFKVRFNCNWGIDRLIDNTLSGDAKWAASNGYLLFTNFSGVPGELATGNDQSNISVNDLADGPGIYTITVAWSPADGWTLALEKTGDLSYDPAEHVWGPRGTAGIDWDNPIKLTYKLDNAVHNWFGFVELAAGEFKVTDGATWQGTGEFTDETGGLLADNGGNVVVSAANAGFYYIHVTTADEGVTYLTTVKKIYWGVIGDAAVGWGDNDDVIMSESGSSMSVVTDLKASGEFKFRADKTWLYNIGGDLTGLTLDGGNLSVASDGSYTITLTTADKGETWTGTVQ